MRLTQLRYFAEICENEGNMTRAAGTLHVSQPALSKALHELEDELGVLLFRRVRQRLELTPDGAYLFGRVKEILRQVDELPDLMRRQRQTQLVLGIHPSLSYFMFDFLNDFSAAFPEITVLLSNSYERRKQLIDSVTSGKMDAAVLVYNTTKNAPDETQLRILTLKQTRTVYVVDQNHPLASKDKVSFSDVANYPLYGHTTKVERKIMSLGLQAKMITNTHDLRMISQMVREHMGGAILLRELAQAIPGSVLIDMEESQAANIAVVAKKEVLPSKVYMLERFFEYAEKNKRKMMYLFEG